MPEELLIRYCAPTLAGLKTGSCFLFRSTDKVELLNMLRSVNRRISYKGVRIILLNTVSESSALLYVYRPAKLKEDLSADGARDLLKRFGYTFESISGCICRLCRRLCDKVDFPHEIGLLLGYPPEDVKGFIDNEAKNSKCCGCWKVYGNEESAKKKFASYKKCTNILNRCWNLGQSIERLTVAD